MKRALLFIAVAGCSTSVAAPAPSGSTAEPGPHFNAAGELMPPTDFRSWQFVTSGFAMAYGPAAVAMAEAGVKAMDNVYVPRAAYQAFGKTGVWPEGTMFVLEVRAGEGTGSIVHGGHFQTSLMAIEAHVLDGKRFEGGSGFFQFPVDGDGPTKPATLLPKEASCYDCHRKNGGVGMTFTQFYPTLFPIARVKGTVRADFVGIPATAADLVAAVAAGGWAAGEKLVDETAKKWPEANLLKEATLNDAAYKVQASGNRDHAIAMFESVARRFPKSANAWDSLSEAYEASGKLEGALEAVGKGITALKAEMAGAKLEQRHVNLKKSLNERRARMLKAMSPRPAK